MKETDSEQSDATDIEVSSTTVHGSNNVDDSDDHDISSMLESVNIYESIKFHAHIVVGFSRRVVYKIFRKSAAKNLSDSD